MDDREKVIYALERCTCHVPDACRDCAYDAEHPDAEHQDKECVEMLLRDALSLLKAQETTAAEEPAKRCGSCKWLRDPEFTCVCVNGDSPNVADFMDLDDSCECWEAQKEENT